MTNTREVALCGEFVTLGNLGRSVSIFFLFNCSHSFLGRGGGGGAEGGGKVFFISKCGLMTSYFF